MTHCKHDWNETTDALQAVFSDTSPSRHHRFWVCSRCLRISEGPAEARRLTSAPRAEADQRVEREKEGEAA